MYNEFFIASAEIATERTDEIYKQISHHAVHQLDRYIDGDTRVNVRVNEQMMILAHFDLEYYRLRMIDVPMREYLNKIPPDEMDEFKNEALVTVELRRKKMTTTVKQFLKKPAETPISQPRTKVYDSGN